LLQDDVLDGIGSGGMGFNNNRWRGLRYFIRLVKELLALPVDARSKLLADPQELPKWLENIPEDEGRQFRHMFLYLLLPDHFDRIFGGSHRNDIVATFTGKTVKQIKQYSAGDIDKQLYQIREQAQEKYGSKELDF